MEVDYSGHVLFAANSIEGLQIKCSQSQMGVNEQPSWPIYFTNQMNDDTMMLL